MKENIDNAIAWIKEQPIKGVLTGSILLDYFPGENQDIDVFVYDEKSFMKLLFAMHYSDMFTILDPLERWKFDQYMDKDKGIFAKQSMLTIKFTYNTCIPVNVIIKKGRNNIFSVLASFDMDIVAKGYDIESKQFLDISGNPEGKKASWNKWNDLFYDAEVWKMSRVLRQLERAFKYYRRGYDTDEVVLKYMELIDGVQKLTDIFNSENYTERLKITKSNTKIVKKICEAWLKDHKITDEEVELIKTKIKEI